MARLRFVRITVAAIGLLGLAAGSGLIDTPLTPAQTLHQRLHQHKLEAREAGMAAAAEVPTQRLADVACIDGMAGPFACNGIDLLAFVPYDEFVGAELPVSPGISDIWGWTDEATGDEYVIIGKSNGVSFFRVTDPASPIHLGTMPNLAVAQLVWHDIKVFDDHVYVVSESNVHGMQVFDLTRLRSATGGQTFLPNVIYPFTVAAHNLAINEDTGYGYIVGGNVGLTVADQCSSGLQMVDLNNPVLPIFAGCWAQDGYTHDTQCVLYDGPDTAHVGREVCISSNEDHVSIVDVTDKSNPQPLGRLEYELTGYTHQGWLTDDHATFLLGDELDELEFEMPTRTLILDVSDLDAPRLIGAHEHATAAIDHNMYTRDGLLYQSNYAAGLRVFDLHRISDGILDEVAWFDTFPAHDDPEFVGTWSNYPYFASGTIAVSGMDEGLFLLRLQDRAAGDVSNVDLPASDATRAQVDDRDSDTPLPSTGGGLAIAASLGLAAAALLRRRS